MEMSTRFALLGRELEAANKYRAEVMEKIRQAVRENEDRGREVPVEQIMRSTGVARQTVYDVIQGKA